MTGDRERCCEAGMDDYVTKPIDRTLLREAILRNIPSIASDAQNNAASVAQTEDDGVKTLSMKRLESACGGDNEFMRELLEDFLSSAPEYTSRIEAAIDTSDPQSLQRSSHAFKGSCRALGCDALAMVCQALEQLGESGQASADACALLLTQLHREYDLLERKLRELISQRAA
jgi:HPt (histidine-containing phosphotransfer) domain-containing protein